MCQLYWLCPFLNKEKIVTGIPQLLAVMVLSFVFFLLFLVVIIVALTTLDDFIFDGKIGPKVKVRIQKFFGV